tara:strand:- start:1151 stop:1387 length:237 start_codon:yes stop_codon:yes gene_type:complete
MKHIYQITIISLIVFSFAFSRSYGNRGVASNFESKISYKSAKKEFLPGTDSSEDNSIKWKRRHKRRKKAKNKRPTRGR